MAASLQDVIDQMAEADIAGLSAGDLVADGRYHRFRPESERKRKKSAWYILFEHVTKSGRTVFNGAFGKGPDTYKVRMSDGGMSVEDRAELARARKEAEKRAAIERKTEAQRAAEKAKRLWGLAHEEGASAYLERKQVRAYGLRFLNGSVLVPVRNIEGALVGCQYIDAEGGKRFNTGMEKLGAFHTLGNAAEADTILFGEGYATCASAHQATRWPVVCCFDSGNLEPVVAGFRKLFPAARFVLLADDDRHLRRRLRERMERVGVPGKVEPDGVAHVFHLPPAEGAVEGVQLRVRAWFEDHAGGKRISFSVQRGDAEARTWHLENAGRAACAQVAKKHNCLVAVPSFAADDAAGTDFNDVHLAEGLGVVRSQILNTIAAFEEAAKRGSDKPPADLPPAQRSSGVGASWRDRLLVRKGELAGCLANVIEIILNDPAWSGVLAYNEFSLRIEKRKALPAGSAELGIWGDSDDVATVLWLTQHYGITPKPADVAQAVEYVAKQHPWHPVREWLRTLRWDGVKRLPGWLARCYGVEQNPYTARVGTWFAMGMVARVMRPGAKFDYCLILEGAQGRGKSTSLAVLGGQWYSDQELDLRNKDAMASLPGVWLQEFSELGALTRHEAHQQKSFLSRTDDRFRPTYGRHVMTVPRQTAFSGSVNDWEWNKDPTGGRRFWPIEVGNIDITWLLQEREQLFAEALHRYDAGERFHPTQQEQREIFDPEQLKREAQDSLQDAIAEWVEKRPSNMEFSKAEVMMDGLKIEPGKMTRDLDTRVGIALKKLGCKRIEKRTNATSRYWYLPPEKTTIAAPAPVPAVSGGVVTTSPAAALPAQQWTGEDDYVDF